MVSSFKRSGARTSFRAPLGGFNAHVQDQILDIVVFPGADGVLDGLHYALPGSSQVYPQAQHGVNHSGGRVHDVPPPLFDPPESAFEDLGQDRLQAAFDARADLRVYVFAAFRPQMLFDADRADALGHLEQRPEEQYAIAPDVVGLRRADIGVDKTS